MLGELDDAANLFQRVDDLLSRLSAEVRVAHGVGDEALLSEYEQLLAQAKTWRPGQRVALVRAWSARSDSLGRHRPCRARPADRSRGAEDRSAEGVRGQTGRKTPTGAALGPHTTWATRTTRVTGG
jgi:hypothetical protein